MSDTFPNTTLQEELVSLMELRISKDYTARHPRTDARRATEAAEERDALDLKIADIQTKIQDAKIISFPTQGGRRSQRTRD